VSPSMIHVLFHLMERRRASMAFIARGEATSYGDLLDGVGAWRDRLQAAGVESGDAVLLRGDFTRDGVAALLALLKAQAIVILLAPSSFEKASEFANVGQADWTVDALSPDPSVTRLAATPGRAPHGVYQTLRERHEAGIVFFSSGSSGRPKGAVHAANTLLEKFRTPGKTLRTLAFLLFDHVAGLDTLFYSLFNGSALVLPEGRSPHEIARLIEEHHVEVLPTAPSFLNLLLLSKAHIGRDLSSLKIITYGSEMMPQVTLNACAEAFPAAKIIQKYGTSEIGALPGQSRASNSTWIRLGGEGYDWRVRDGRFEIKARTAMLGYLNAPSPFTEDGYFMTGDRVEQDGDFIRFLGRDSDIINVGGQKVYPAEVENLIREVPGVAEAAVFGQPHPILGAMVVARVYLEAGVEGGAALRQAIRGRLSGTLESYKIPQKIVVSDEPLTTARFKTIRRN
jgi:long-chain acyl-CoA synthetase